MAYSTNRYPFYVGGHLVHDWGHFLRAMGRDWTWIERVLSWNPCNHIGQLYGYKG